MSEPEVREIREGSLLTMMRAKYVPVHDRVEMIGIVIERNSNTSFMVLWAEDSRRAWYTGNWFKRTEMGRYFIVEVF